VEKNTGKSSLEISLTDNGRKTKVNHVEQKRIADYIGQLKVVLFAPEDLETIKGSPIKRRRFLNLEISQLSPIYLYELIQYQTILKQRNTYLKQFDSDSKSFDEIYFNILTQQLCQFGAKVIHNRLKFIEKLEQHAQRLHSTISEQREELNLKYLASFPLPENLSVENLFDCFLETTKQKKGSELYRRTTLFGPHRDDLEFSIGDLSVPHGASQGQIRTAALAIKISEIELVHEQCHEYPLLLLDDVLSELDNLRQTNLIENILEKTQTFFTVTTLKHLGKLPKKIKIFNIKNGTVF